MGVQYDKDGNEICCEFCKFGPACSSSDDCLGDFDNSGADFDYLFFQVRPPAKVVVHNDGFAHSWSYPDDTTPKCTCTNTGPRWEENVGGMCNACKAFQKKYFPAFPGQPGWVLNYGWEKRQAWGINIDNLNLARNDRFLRAAHKKFYDTWG